MSDIWDCPVQMIHVPLYVLYSTMDLFLFYINSENYGM